MKKLLGILVIGLCGITRYKLDTGEIKQEKRKSE
jgi:hypothetical protein